MTLPQHRDREMRLADARRTDQAQALARRRETRSANRRACFDRAEQLLVGVSDKGFEIAAAIARRNARFVEQPRRQPFTPAVAAHDAAHAVGLHRLPAGIVAESAGHADGRRDVIVTVTSNATITVQSNSAARRRASIGAASPWRAIRSAGCVRATGASMSPTSCSVRGSPSRSRPNRSSTTSRSLSSSSSSARAHARVQSTADQLVFGRRHGRPARASRRAPDRLSPSADDRDRSATRRGRRSASALRLRLRRYRGRAAISLERRRALELLGQLGDLAAEARGDAPTASAAARTRGSAPRARA